MLQADILAKAELPRTLEQNINHAEAFEMAMQDQNKISGISDVGVLPTKMGSKCSPFEYYHSVRENMVEMHSPNIMHVHVADSYWHGETGTSDWLTGCVLHGVKHAMNVANTTTLQRSASQRVRINEVPHQSFKDEGAVMDTLIVHVVCDLATDTYKVGYNNSCKKVEETMIPFSLCPDLGLARDIPIKFTIGKGP